MRRSVFCIAVALLLAGCPDAAKPGVDPLIEGPRLESESLDFRIEAPEGYTWRNDRLGRDKHRFVATNGSTEVRLSIDGLESNETPDDRALRWVNMMRTVIQRGERAVEDVVMIPRRSKLGSGYVYAFRTGRGERVSGYVVATKRLYALEHTGTTTEDVLSPFIAGLAPAR